MKILVFGSRKWMDQRFIEEKLKAFPSDTIVVHGAAPGADNVAGYVAKTLGMVVRPYPANWKKYGKSAGPIRNQQMLDEEDPDKDGVWIERAICFHTDPGLGVGSKDMKWRIDKIGQGVNRAPVPVDVYIKK